MINLFFAILPTAARSTSTRSSIAARENVLRENATRENQRLNESPHVAPTAVTRFKTADDDTVYVARCLQATDESARLEAFGVLLARHRERVLNLAWQMLGSRDDAEDAAQEAFISAFHGLHTFRSEARFGTWIYRIAINVCLSRQRRAKTCDSLNDLEMENVASPLDSAGRAEKRVHVARVLDALSPPLRAVLVLREIHELSYEEIARVLSVPVGTVRSRLSEARRKFIALWEAE